MSIYLAEAIDLAYVPLDEKALQLRELIYEAAEAHGLAVYSPRDAWSLTPETASPLAIDRVIQTNNFARRSATALVALAVGSVSSWGVPIELSDHEREKGNRIVIYLLADEDQPTPIYLRALTRSPSGSLYRVYLEGDNWLGQVAQLRNWLTALLGEHADAAIKAAQFLRKEGRDA